MKITSFKINRSEIIKKNIKNNRYNYISVMNNNTSLTSDKIITAATTVLLDMYSDIKESEKSYEQAD